MTAHMLVVSRTIFTVTFVFSAAAKLRGLDAFRVALEDLRILPLGWARPLARIIVSTEALFAVVIAIGVGLPYAMAAAALVLLAFTSALALAMRRKGGAVSCNCFGASSTRVSGYDLIRNAILVGIGALSALSEKTARQPIPASELALSVLVGVAAAMIVINFGDVARTLWRPFTLRQVT